MKREILFKGKRFDNGEWVFGFLMQDNFIRRKISCLRNGKKRIAYGQHEVHPETVCQFTGLLDKNGNKIFEGDKINFSCAINGSFIDSVVEYDSIDGVWSINWDKEKNRVHYFFNEIEECEIIGNIYDQ